MNTSITKWIQVNPIKTFVFLSLWLFALNFIAMKLETELKLSNSTNVGKITNSTKPTEKLDELLRQLSRNGLHDVIRLGDSASYPESANYIPEHTKELLKLGIIREYTTDEYTEESKRTGKISFGHKTTDLGKRAQARLFEILEGAVAR